MHLIQDFEEDRQDRIPSDLAVDVEEDHIGVKRYCPLHVSKQHGIVDLRLEEIDGVLRFPIMMTLLILKQIHKDLDVVRFTRAKEARNPHVVV